MKTQLTPELLKQLYTNEGKTAKQIAQQTDYCKATILYHLKKFNIPTRKEWWLKGRPKITKEFLEQEYAQKGKTIEKIAKETGYKRRKIMRAMQNFGIQTRMKQRREKFNQHYSSIDVGNMTWDYIGGFIDAEGTIYRWRHLYRVSIVNTNKEVLEKIRAFVGYGTLTYRTWLSHHGTARPRLRKQPIFTLSLCRKEIGEKLSSHIVLKRARIEDKFGIKLVEPQISWSYIAGLFDGDGWICQHNGSCKVGIASKHLDFLRTIKSFLNYGFIEHRKWHGRIFNGPIMESIQYVQIIIRHENVLDFCRHVLPFLTIKKEKVEKIKTFIENKKWRQG